MRTIPTYRKSGRLFILREMAIFQQLTCDATIKGHAGDFVEMPNSRCFPTVALALIILNVQGCSRRTTLTISQLSQPLLAGVYLTSQFSTVFSCHHSLQ